MSERECKHRFEPRYSERFPQALSDAIRNGQSFDYTGPGIRFERIYECDVCKHCGKVVKP